MNRATLNVEEINVAKKCVCDNMGWVMFNYEPRIDSQYFGHRFYKLKEKNLKIVGMINLMKQYQY